MAHHTRGPTHPRHEPFAEAMGWHQMNPRLDESHEQYMDRVAPPRKRTAMKWDPAATAYTHKGPKGERGAITEITNVMTFSLALKPVTNTGICSRYLFAELGMNATSATDNNLWPTAATDLLVTRGQFWTATDSFIATSKQYMEYRLASVKLEFVPLQSIQTGAQVDETGSTINEWQQGLYDNAEIRIGLVRPDSQLTPNMYPIPTRTYTNEAYLPLTSDPDAYLTLPYSKYYRWSDLTKRGRSTCSIMMRDDSFNFDQWYPTGSFLDALPGGDWQVNHTWAPITTYQPGTYRTTANAAWLPRYAWMAYCYVDLHLNSTTQAQGNTLPATPINMFQIRVSYKLEYRRPTWLYGISITPDVDAALGESYRQKVLREICIPPHCTVIRGITLGRDPLQMLASAAEAISDAEAKLLGCEDMAAVDLRSIDSGRSQPVPVSAFVNLPPHRSRVISRAR